MVDRVASIGHLLRLPYIWTPFNDHGSSGFLWNQAITLIIPIGVTRFHPRQRDKITIDQSSSNSRPESQQKQTHKKLGERRNAYLFAIEQIDETLDRSDYLFQVVHIPNYSARPHFLIEFFHEYISMAARQASGACCLPKTRRL